MNLLVHLCCEDDEDDSVIHTLCGKYSDDIYEYMRRDTRWEAVHYTYITKPNEKKSENVDKLLKPPYKTCKKCMELLPIYALRD